MYNTTPHPCTRTHAGTHSFRPTNYAAKTGEDLSSMEKGISSETNTCSPPPVWRLAMRKTCMGPWAWGY